MKKIFGLFYFLISIQIAFAQRLNIDSAIHAIAIEKNADKKLEYITNFYSAEFNNDPLYIIEVGIKLLKQAQTDNDLIEEASAYSALGHGYRLMGNAVKGLEFHQKAIIAAEKSNILSVLAIAENQIGHIYKDREEYNKAIKIYLSSSDHAEKGNNEKIKSWPLLNLAAVYLLTNQLDSALLYAQKRNEYVMRTKDKNSLPFTYTTLAGVYSKMGNNELAITYYNLALQQAALSYSPRYTNMVFTGLAEHYNRLHNSDSAHLYARKAIAVLNATPLFYLSAKPAKMLADFYENSNCDSTLKYAKIFKTANDSLTSSKANQQIQMMTFDENLRQQEIIKEKLKDGEERKQNIQYALIALGIIILLGLYLLLSRSFITNTRLIEFFGVIALLIVFEFLNLLLHPFLERITHHSPVLMLLALVCIAALLVPLHHKVEHWATKKLVEKNKEIRLAAAKKTIEQLDKNNDQ